MLVALLVVGGLALAGFVAYKIFRSGKALTGAAVVAGVETVVKAEANSAVSAVKTEVNKVI